MASEAEAAGFAASEKLYGIADLAREFGITARAIRFYESKGLLAPPRVNGGRVYTRRERGRLRLLLRAKSIGFSLAEIKRAIREAGYIPHQRNVFYEYIDSPAVEEAAVAAG